MSIPLAIIAEDEPLLRAEIRETLRLLWPELRVCAEASDGQQAIDALQQFAPNILFLDIHMPGLNGIEVARQASEKAHVVFITAYDTYAVDAFADGALDYIVKPISAERMKITVERLQNRLREPPADLSGLVDMLKSAVGVESRFLKWLTVPHGAELRVLGISEIIYLRADNKYTTVNTRSSSFLLNSALKELQAKLDPSMFWQIHRGIVVNVSAIDSIYRSFRGTLELKMKDRTELLPVSASHAHLFKHA